MATQLSPGILIQEVDQTSVAVPAGTSDAAFAAGFQWGPADQVVTITSESDLLATFGKPDSDTEINWLSAANFLNYVGALQVVRTTDGSSKNAGTDRSGSTTQIAVENSDVYDQTTFTSASPDFIARYPGDLGESLQVAVCPASTVQTTVASTATGATNTAVVIGGGATFTLSAGAHASIAGNDYIEISGPLAGDDGAVRAGGVALPTDTLAGETFAADGTTSGFLIVGVTDGVELTTGSGSALNIRLTWVGTAITAVTVLAGGSGYAVDDVITITAAALATANVLTVAGTGTLTFSITDVLDESEMEQTTVRAFVSTAGSTTTIHKSHGLDEAASVQIVKPEQGAFKNYALVNDSSTAIGEQQITVEADHHSKLNIGDTFTFNGIDGVTTTHSTIYEVVTNATTTITFKQSGGDSGSGLTAAVPNSSVIISNWKYSTNFDTSPTTSDYVSGKGGANDEMHIAVIDEDGLIGTGTKGYVLETYPNLSAASDGKSSTGAITYFKDVIRTSSSYIYVGSGIIATGTNWGGDSTTTFTLVAGPYLETFEGGVMDNSTAGSNSAANRIIGFNKFADPETTDVSLIFPGDTDNAAALYASLISLTNTRKDAVLFLSPAKSIVVNSSSSTIGQDIADWFNGSSIGGEAGIASLNSSYVVADSGWKRVYNRYTDKYVDIPLNSDIAGLCARTDLTREVFYSPAGYERGVLQNVIKLHYNPDKADRDILYKNAVNPVVNFPGQGVILFGDKTKYNKPSAFDRINVRRLFLFLEKTISRAARVSLFEFNDESTRRSFASLVTPLLNEIKSKRGLYDFLVVCDESNNTADVIDRNEFVGDIYLKPARSINFIRLNFVAVRTGVAFSEVATA